MDLSKTENPCVGGSIPCLLDAVRQACLLDAVRQASITTKKADSYESAFLMFLGRF
jgi:hypothetical protein